MRLLIYFEKNLTENVIVLNKNVVYFRSKEDYNVRQGKNNRRKVGKILQPT